MCHHPRLVSNMHINCIRIPKPPIYSLVSNPMLAHYANSLMFLACFNTFYSVGFQVVYLLFKYEFIKERRNLNPQETDSEAWDHFISLLKSGTIKRTIGSYTIELELDTTPTKDYKQRLISRCRGRRQRGPFFNAICMNRWCPTTIIPSRYKLEGNYFENRYCSDCYSKCHPQGLFPPQKKDTPGSSKNKSATSDIHTPLNQKVNNATSSNTSTPANEKLNNTSSSNSIPPAKPKLSTTSSSRTSTAVNPNLNNASSSKPNTLAKTNKNK